LSVRPVALQLKTSWQTATGWLLTALWVVTASATLIENDAYRYSGIVLMIYGGVAYCAMRPRPPVSWPAWLCIGWGSYALGRFLLQYLLEAGHPQGDGELMYAMPLAFPSLAFALYLGWSRIQQIVATYFGVALAMLVFTTHYRAVIDGETVRPLIQHNQIHGAVCCGVILIMAIFWLIHCRTSASASNRMRSYATVVAPLIGLLCLFCIYGAKSKGVWLALVCCAPFLLFSIVGWFRTTSGLIAIGCLMLTATIGGYAVHRNLEKTAGPTFVATSGLFGDIISGDPVGAAVASRIDDRTTPIAMDERLQLWSNAYELLSSAPIFGLGNAWEPRWHQTHYRAVDYAAMHNGYLEILVRYGVAGALFLAGMAFAFLRRVEKAAQMGLIPTAVSHGYLIVQIFFGLTLLSNSNNRLAIGETIIMLSFTFALTCHLLIRAASAPSHLPAGRDA